MTFFKLFKYHLLNFAGTIVVSVLITLIVNSDAQGLEGKQAQFIESIMAPVALSFF